MIYRTAFLRRVHAGLPFKYLCIKPKVDALTHFYKKKAKWERKIEQLNDKEYPSTGVGFVTFKRVEWKKQFIKDWRKTTMPRCRLSRPLHIHRWIVTSAPNSDDIRWKNLRVGVLEYAARFLLVNLFLLSFLFFFTTPVAMMGGVRQYASELFDFRLTFLSKLETSRLGGLLVGYIPSLLLLGLSVLMPWLLYCT